MRASLLPLTAACAWIMLGFQTEVIADDRLDRKRVLLFSDCEQVVDTQDEIINLTAVPAIAFRVGNPHIYGAYISNMKLQFRSQSKERMDYFRRNLLSHKHEYWELATERLTKIICDRWQKSASAHDAHELEFRLHVSQKLVLTNGAFSATTTCTALDKSDAKGKQLFDSIEVDKIWCFPLVKRNCDPNDERDFAAVDIFEDAGINQVSFDLTFGKGNNRYPTTFESAVAAGAQGIRTLDERKKNMFLVLHDHSSGWDRNPLIDVRRETDDLPNEREDPMLTPMPHYRMSFAESLRNLAPEQAEFRKALKSVKASDALDQISKKTGRSARRYYTWIPE